MTVKDTENSNLSAKMSKAKNCILNFHGMSLTRDKMCGMVKKWQTMIQCAVDAKTTDNYHLRVFVVAFTKKQSQGQIKKTTYAQSQQVKQIRKKMTEIVSKQVSNCDVPDQEDHLRSVSAGQADPKEDDRDRQQAGVQLRRARSRRPPTLSLSRSSRSERR